MHYIFYQYLLRISCFLIYVIFVQENQSILIALAKLLLYKLEEDVGIEPTGRIHNHGLAIRSFNHSGNLPLKHLLLCLARQPLLPSPELNRACC